MQSKKIIFIGSACDFHAMDWYHNIKKICVNGEVLFATDIKRSEGFSYLVEDGDNIIDLFNIDWFLFRNQSALGNIWRNFVKLFFFPLQVQRLKRIAKNNKDAIYHAHTMYYLFIGWRAGIKYIGSPQGDEVLIRPYRSRLYKYFAIRSLKAAENIIIDSINLQNGIRKLCGKESRVIQYGIDVTTIANIKNSDRQYITSIRALYPLYRIHEILNARDRCGNIPSLLLFYPFWEEGYKERIFKMLNETDINMGRIAQKADMYKVLASTVLAISIPESDSSPRSVYESIFCGCCVAVTYNPWIESLPECMRKRTVVVDLKDKFWLAKAIEAAKMIVKEPYIPSEQALNMFDQERSMRLVAQKFYNYL